VHLHLRGLIQDDAVLATTEPVMLEVLSGAKSQGDYVRLRQLLHDCELLSSAGVWVHEAAADLYRSCRARGITPRKLMDCLVAVAAIRGGVPLLHQDRDFDLIAAHTDLLIEPV
jgi:predicted nucleic acid-binding protein